jgi:hypothetical protein
LVNLEIEEPTSSETPNDGLDSISMKVDNYSLFASCASDTNTIGGEDNNTETTDKTENIDASDNNDANKASNVKDVNDENIDNTENATNGDNDDLGASNDDDDASDDASDDKNDKNGVDYDKDIDAKKTNSAKYFTPDTHAEELPINADENTAICSVCAKSVNLQRKCALCQKCSKFVQFSCGNTGKKVGQFKNCAVHTKKVQRYLLFFFFLTPVYNNITPVCNIITLACNIITPACNIIITLKCNNIMPALWFLHQYTNINCFSLQITPGKKKAQRKK